MTGAVYFLVFLIAIAVFINMIGAGFLLYLLIDDQLYKRKRQRGGKVIKGGTGYPTSIDSPPRSAVKNGIR